MFDFKVSKYFVQTVLDFDSCAFLCKKITWSK